MTCDDRAFDDLIQNALRQPPLPMAVAHPCSPDALRGAVEAAATGLIEPILVGPQATLQRLAEQIDLDLAHYRVVDVANSHAAAARAVELVRSGEARSLMKGSLHTDEFIGAVLDRNTGIRTGRLLSHVYLVKAERYPRYLFITDAAINIAPDLAAKRHIAQNAIDLCHALGIATPRLAILAAVETVNPAMPATLDAAALCKMAERGQISGALLDGPLAFDNAISAEAAASKGIVSPVAGQPDILLVPNLEAGNMLAKQLVHLSGAAAAGVVMGARAPIVLNSRAESARVRLASAAVAALVAQHAEAQR